MELRQLEYVVAVADHGSFTAGALAAHVAQPSLSQAVRTLEAELGLDLFHRVGRSVVLSAAGTAFVGAARQVLRDVADARAAVSAVGELVAGTLDVAALPTLAVDPLAGLVGAFRAAHPGVHVRVLDPGESMTVAALVRAGRAELGLADASASDAGEGVLARPLGQQELLAVCAPGLLRGTRARPLAELAALPLVVTPPGTSTRRVIDAALAAAGVAPTVAVEVDQREAVVPLVLAGAGIAFLPETQASEAGRLGAQVVRPQPVLVRSIVLLHRDRPLSPAGRAFVTLAVGPHDEPRTMGR